MGKHWWYLVSCLAVDGASSPHAIVAGEPGATAGDVGRVGALHSTGAPFPVQGQANCPYQRSVADSAVAFADMAVLPEPVVDTEGGLVVVAPGVEDTLVAVAQPVAAAPLRLVVPAHIASHSSLAVLVLPAAAEAILVLRFPLYSLYTSKINVFQVVIVAFQ